MVLKKVKITEDELMYVQRLFYELTGYENLIRTILDIKDFEPNKELFDSLLDKHKDANTLFNLAMEELKEKYIEPELLVDGTRLITTVSFVDSYFYLATNDDITRKGGGRKCSTDL